MSAKAISLPNPIGRHIAHESFERHCGRLSTFQNGLRNVGRQKGQLHDPPDISTMEAGLGSDCSLMGHLALCDAFDPFVSPGYCFDQGWNGLLQAPPASDAVHESSMPGAEKTPENSHSK